MGNDTQWLVGWLFAIGLAVGTIATTAVFGIGIAAMALAVVLLLAALAIMFAAVGLRR